MRTLCAHRAERSLPGGPEPLVTYCKSVNVGTAQDPFARVLGSGRHGGTLHTRPVPASSNRVLDESWRGVFADGWTNEMADRYLPQISDAIGHALVVLWERWDWMGGTGDSDLFVEDPNGDLREPPDGLWQFITGGDGDGTLPSLELGPVCYRAGDYRRSDSLSNLFLERG